MNPEIKARWVAALRSGEYQQTRKNLRDENGFCCLGVLCDLHARETGTGWDKGLEGDYIYNGTSTFLPYVVAYWAGLENAHPVTAGGVSLADLNDTGHDFNFIADVIENNEIL